MPPPPPPPRLPPSAPLPPPPPAAVASHTNSNSTGTPDRSALLSQIRGGAKLKKAVTNDRSSPSIQKSSSGNGLRNQSTASSSPLCPGDLFSQGIPKLRPTANRAAEGKTTQQPGFFHNNSFQFGVKTSNALSQPPSLSSEAQTNKASRIQIKNTVGYNESNSSQTLAKPAPPPSKLKPNFLLDSTPGTPLPRMPLPGKTSFRPSVNTLVAHEQSTPTVPNVTKEDSHISSSSKPLPPPKQTHNIIKSDDHFQNKPIPPSKLSVATWNTNVSVNRSTNINVKEKDLVKPLVPVIHNQTITSSSLLCNRQSNRPELKMSTLTANSSRLPVRNHSAPDINQLVRHNSSRPPPPIPPTSRMIQSPSLLHQTQTKFQNGRPALPPQPTLTRSAEPPPLPKSAPPPLPHRSPQTLPRFTTRGQTNAPPLPARVSSKQNSQHCNENIQDFESRFKQMFHETQEFPFPFYQITPHKYYMSQAYTQEIKGASIDRQMNNRLLVVKAAEC